MNVFKVIDLKMYIFVDECGTSGGEDEDDSEERTDFEVRGREHTTFYYHYSHYTLLFWSSCLIFGFPFVLEMRNVMQTTPLTLSSTCILRRAKVCLTAGRMSLAICSRCATQSTSSDWFANTHCLPATL